MLSYLYNFYISVEQTHYNIFLRKIAVEYFPVWLILINVQQHCLPFWFSLSLRFQKKRGISPLKWIHYLYTCISPATIWCKCHNSTNKNIFCSRIAVAMYIELQGRRNSVQRYDRISNVFQIFLPQPTAIWWFGIICRQSGLLKVKI